MHEICLTIVHRGSNKRGTAQFLTQQVSVYRGVGGETSIVLCIRGRWNIHLLSPSHKN